MAGSDARGAGDVQAEPADEAAPAHRGLRQGPHAQQRPHTRGGATDEVGWNRLGGDFYILFNLPKLSKMYVY